MSIATTADTSYLGGKMPKHSDGKISSGGFKLDAWVTTPASDFKYGRSEVAGGPAKAVGRDASTGQFVPIKTKPKPQGQGNDPGYALRGGLSDYAIAKATGRFQVVGQSVGPKPKPVGGYSFKKIAKKSPPLISRSK